MLNGVAPILIFNFTNKSVTSFLSGLSIPESVGNTVGIPVPIYLDEKLTGIFVDSETSGIDIDNEVEALNEKAPGSTEVKSAKVKQKAIDSTITVNLIARDDSVLLTALIATCNMILKRVVTQEYSITYLHKSTAIFGGLLHSFHTSVRVNDNLINMELTISTAKQQDTKGESRPDAIPVNVGQLPPAPIH